MGGRESKLVVSIGDEGGPRKQYVVHVIGSRGYAEENHSMENAL